MDFFLRADGSGLPCRIAGCVSDSFLQFCHRYLIDARVFALGCAGDLRDRRSVAGAREFLFSCRVPVLGRVPGAGVVRYAYGTPAFGRGILRHRFSNWRL